VERNDSDTVDGFLCWARALHRLAAERGVRLDALPLQVLSALLAESKSSYERAIDQYNSWLMPVDSIDDNNDDGNNNNNINNNDDDDDDAGEAAEIVNASVAAWRTFAADRLQLCWTTLGEWEALERWQQLVRAARVQARQSDGDATRASQQRLAKLDSLIDDNFVQAQAAYERNDAARAAELLAVTPIDVLAVVAPSQQPTLARCDVRRRQLCAERVLFESIVHRTLRLETMAARAAAARAVASDIDALWKQAPPRLATAAAPLPPAALHFSSAVLQPPLRVLYADAQRSAITLFGVAQHHSMLAHDNNDNNNDNDNDNGTMYSNERNNVDIASLLPTTSRRLAIAPLTLVGSSLWHTLDQHKSAAHMIVDSARQTLNFRLAERVLNRL
jgi:hypothetical protein